MVALVLGAPYRAPTGGPIGFRGGLGSNTFCSMGPAGALLGPYGGPVGACWGTFGSWKEQELPIRARQLHPLARVHQSGTLVVGTEMGAPGQTKVTILNSQEVAEVQA